MAAKKKKKRAKKTTRKKACKCPKGWRKKGAKACTKARRVMPLACMFKRKRKRRESVTQVNANVLPMYGIAGAW